jgi:hypothetical protein
VNLAFGNTGPLHPVRRTERRAAAAAPSRATPTRALSTAQLTGTGFDIVNPAAQFANDPGYCGSNDLAGGGTGWLTTTGNVVPGEIIELRFTIWDTGDQWYDSLVLLDNFQWSVNASTPGTKIE